MGRGSRTEGWCQTYFGKGARLYSRRCRLPTLACASSHSKDGLRPSGGVPLSSRWRWDGLALMTLFWRLKCLCGLCSQPSRSLQKLWCRLLLQEYMLLPATGFCLQASWWWKWRKTLTHRMWIPQIHFEPLEYTFLHPDSWSCPRVSWSGGGQQTSSRRWSARQSYRATECLANCRRQTLAPRFWTLSRRQMSKQCLSSRYWSLPLTCWHTLCKVWKCHWINSWRRAHKG